jgi:hypothetical protein
MKIENLKTVEAISTFLDGTENIAFTIIDTKLERYERIQKVLLSIKYSSLSKHEKGIVIKFIFLLGLMKCILSQMEQQLKKYVKEHI